MALMQCKNCDKAFDTSLIPAGSAMVCTYCGFNNSDPLAQPKKTAGSAQNSLSNETPDAASSGTQVPLASSGPRVMSEWERDWKTKPFNAYINTVRAVVTTPATYFGTILPFEDYLGLAVLIYISSFIGMLAGIAFQHFVGVGIMTAFTHKLNLGADLIQLPFQLCAAVVFPAIIILFVLIGAGIQHFFLKFIGGSSKGFDTTFTVVGLTSVVNIFQVVPILGALAALVYHIIISIAGQAEAHEISPFKAFLAWITPTLICCCCFGMFYFFVIAAIVGGASHMR